MNLGGISSHEKLYIKRDEGRAPAAVVSILAPAAQEGTAASPACSKFLSDFI